MSTEIFFSSKKLGTVMDDQLQLMLDRWDLGQLLSSGKTANGVMGQTLFVSSSQGDFILKGNPLYPGQFQEEKYFVEYLHRQAQVPVAFPYLVDESDDIFGWSYALMPRLPGIHLSAGQDMDQIKIAERLARTLGELHSWKVDHFGEFEPRSRDIRPFEGSYRAWLYTTIRYWLEDAKKYSTITPEDEKWVEHLLERSKSAFDKLQSPTFVMGDFKPENFLLEEKEEGWTVSGVFDFTSSYFGDPIADLPKMTAYYLNAGEKEAASAFLSSYLKSMRIEKEVFVERFSIHMLHRCVLDWGCAKAIKKVTWDEALSFSGWAVNFTEAAPDIL